VTETRNLAFRFSFGFMLGFLFEWRELNEIAWIVNSTSNYNEIY
jgi:hypothetical protein